MGSPISYKANWTDGLINYLDKRLLSPFEGCEMRSLSFHNKLYLDDIFLYTFDLGGSVSQVEVRSTIEKSYTKLYENTDSIPVYNINKLFHADRFYRNVILCESIFDAESFNQHLGRFDTIALSTNSASIRKIQELFLVALLKNRNVYTAFDNDSVGLANAVRFKDSYGWRPLDFRGSDVNAFLMKHGSFSFSRHFNPLLSS